MISGVLKVLGINSSDCNDYKEPKINLEGNNSESNITEEVQNHDVELEFWDIEKTPSIRRSVHANGEFQ